MKSGSQVRLGVLRCALLVKISVLVTRACLWTLSSDKKGRRYSAWSAEPREIITKSFSASRVELPPTRLAKSKDGIFTLKELLDHYEKPEVLKGDNKVFCPRCERRTDHEKKITFWKLPYIFVVVFKRFEYDSYGHMHKRHTDVTSPMRINLNRFEKNGKGAGYSS